MLYVQDCPHYQETLAMVERVRAELGIDADLHSTLVVDQAAADQARFPGSPTVRVNGHDVEPGSEPAAEYVVGCTGSSTTSPASPRSAGSARDC